MRVLHVMHWSNGGVSQLAQVLTANHGKEKARLVVLRTNGGVLRNDICYVALNAGWGRVLLQLRKLIMAFEPNIVHVHSFTPHLLCCLARCSNVRIVRTVHNNYPYFTDNGLRARCKRLIEGYLLSKCTNVVTCVSRTVERNLPWTGIRSEVIYNGIDFHGIAAKTQAAGRSRLPTTEERFITVGRLEPQKGLDDLIDAFGRLAKERPKASLTILGEGSLKAELEHKICGNGLTGRVFLVGHKENPFSFLSQADIYVSSSRYEGFNLALAEAMSLGMPAISTDAGGVTDELVHGKHLLIAKCGDIASLYREMSRLAGDDQLRAQLGREGADQVKKLFSLKKMTYEYEDLYERVSA